MVRTWEGFHYKDRWQALQQRGMRQNFSWDKSAVEYIKVYSEILGIPLEENMPNESREEVATPVG
jgi:starch synthase